MALIKFVDTTLRDGSASLWAMEMRTRHMIPALKELDEAGFDSMEFFAPGSRLKKFVRHLREDPWEWVKQGTAIAKNTPLRWHGGPGGSRMSGQFSPEVGNLLISRAVELGIRQTRLMSNWNNIEALAEDKRQLEALGMTPVLDIVYSVSPRHTDEYFIEKARDVAALKPFRICLKDVGGLLTPDRVRSLLPLMLAETPGVEWEFHGHCNNGFGPLNALAAAEVGFAYLHTAVSPLAYADSHPDAINLRGNLMSRGFDVSLNVDRVDAASQHLHSVAEDEGFPVGTPNPYDESLYTHQVPGGMIANFKHQLKQIDMLDRLPEILEEVARVREDFGFPIMVTPLSQIVGTQAAINVISGARYKEVSDESIHYALGRHGGDEAIALMKQDVRDQILDRRRAKELRSWEPPSPTLAQLRERFGQNVSDDELILRAIVGDDAMEVINADVPEQAGLSSVDSLITLMKKMSTTAGQRKVSVGGIDLSITLQSR
jgi:oxaloacetate decarboxylase alpha subunit